MQKERDKLRDMTGLDVLRKLRALDTDAVVVMMTPVVWTSSKSSFIHEA